MIDISRRQEFNTISVGDIINAFEEDLSSYKEYLVKVTGIKYDKSQKVIIGIDLINRDYKNIYLSEFKNITRKTEREAA